MTSLVRILSLSLLALSAPLAHAHSAITRDQVRAELADATRSGQLLAPGESGATLRELNPQRYAGTASPATTAPPRTRAEVVHDLQAAQRAGDGLVLGEMATGPEGRALGAPATRRSGSVLTRAQVVAAYREAALSGGLLGLGETGKQPAAAAAPRH